MHTHRIAYATEVPRTADAVIVGGGISGLAAAFFAVRAGLRVVVIERRPRLASLTTAAATGGYRLQFDNVDELELVREGVEFYQAFAERTGVVDWSIGLRPQGYLFCTLTEEAGTRARELVTRQRTWGLDDVELLDGDEARRRHPYLSAEVRQARFRAGDGFIDPVRLAHGYALGASAPERIPDAERGGAAQFATATTVLAIDVAPGGGALVVTTSRGPVSTSSVILATGPFLGETGRLVGLDLPIAPVVRHKLIFPALPEVPEDAPMTIEDETGAHWRPALAGCFAMWTSPDPDEGPPLDPVPVDPGFAWGLLDPASGHAMARLVPFWNEVWDRGADHWFLQAGQYEVTPDHRPLIGPTAVPGVFVNGGFSGHGVMSSAGGARRTVDLLLGRADPAASPFRVDRSFAERARDVL